MNALTQLTAMYLQTVQTPKYSLSEAQIDGEPHTVVCVWLPGVVRALAVTTLL